MSSNGIKKLSITEKTNRPKHEDGAFAEAQQSFLMVAIGASAGGMEAFNELLSNLPTDTGMAFILIQHLDPKHESQLAGLLSKETAMRVVEAVDGMQVLPDQVFVIPPNSSMTISDRTLHLTPRPEARGAHMSVDQFMRSLAQQQGNRAIGVVLSGSGTDGTLGLAEIQAQGGVTFAQEESSAKFDGMPHSAIAAGFVDYILPPAGIARELTRIARHPYVSREGPPEPSSLPLAENAGLISIFQLLRRSTGIDFANYRSGTILRRIQRRMMVHKIDRLNDYVRYLQTNPTETNALSQDMLIKVTSFFRNPKVFDALTSTVFPALLKGRSGEGNIRIWTPGCASGEETYSVAMALLEYLGDKAGKTAIQVFGTDIGEMNIIKARAGLYPENIQSDVNPARLRRFFIKAEGGYRISKSVRDMCIFAHHNLLSDPPFSQMDLICCRNLLIYFEPVLQNKAISLFHYALRGSGYLVLGTSEGIGSARNLSTVRTRGVEIRAGNGSGDARQRTRPGGRPVHNVDLEVSPITVGTMSQRYFMIVFHELPEAHPRPQRSLKAHKRAKSTDRRVEHLGQELEATKEFLQSVIETHEATNEELQSANEEILSSNEELQSTNEEIETAKEELQSTNEELITVNDELQARNSEVNLINNDLLNALASIDMAIVMVNRDLVIRRFTVRAQKMLGLVAADVGRPLWNLNTMLDLSDLRQLTQQVINSKRPLEQEVRGKDSIAYHLRILPCRMGDEKAGGAVITLTDMSGKSEHKEAGSGGGA